MLARVNLRWVDGRLASVNDTTEGLDGVVISQSHNIWKPDIYFTNLRSSTTQHFTHSGTWIYPNGTVVRSIL